MNQGFFEKLWIAHDGSVERAEMTTPFRALLKRPADGHDEKPHHQVNGDEVMGSHKDVMVVLTGARSSLDSLKKLTSLPVGETRRRIDHVTRQDQRRLTPADIVALVQAYRRGADMRQLAQDFGVHRTTVSEHLRRLGIPLRRQGLANGDLAEASRLYAAGWSLARLGERFGCDPETVRQSFVRAGIARRSPN